MNGQHFRAFLWLHWRLRVNQFRKGGTANAVFLIILIVLAVLTACGFFALALILGLFAFENAEPSVLMFTWDGLVLTFLFSWMIGLFASLQRSEALSPDLFLHLPVSLRGVFILNYLTSLVGFTTILFVPAMAGLGLGLIVTRGPALLLIVPLVVSFLLMVTALSYQFQGWLASLMVNKRRRRTILFVVTAVFILIFQLPNLINIYRPWSRAAQPVDEAQKELMATHTELTRALTAGEIDLAQHQARLTEAQNKFQEQIAATHRTDQRTLQLVKDYAELANMVLPIGWLPWGAMKAAQGEAWFAALAVLGMTLIGAVSLRRAYRTTLRLYTGEFTAGKTLQARPVAATPEPARSGPRKPGLLERDVPWLSEQAAAIALCGFRALTRAPEVKMLLLSPIVMVFVFGGIFMRGDMDPPTAVRPLLAFGGVAMVMLNLVSLVGNQFGFDRSGFRVFVLSPARRGDILIGKNMAVAPIAAVLGLLTLGLVEFACPLRVDHLLAMAPSIVSMYLLFCLLANCLSILAPMQMAAGSIKPQGGKALAVLLNFAMILVFPLTLAPALLPLGVEVLSEALDWTQGWPIFLVLSVVECIAIVFLFRWLVGWQGVWLQHRELRILEIVTTKAE